MIYFSVLFVTLNFVSAIQAITPYQVNSSRDQNNKESLTTRQDRLESLLESALNKITFLEEQLALLPKYQLDKKLAGPGRDVVGLPTGCADVFYNGNYQNDFFLVKGSNGKIDAVYCDFTNSTGLGLETRMGFVDIKTSPVHFYVQRESSVYPGNGMVLRWEKSRLNMGNAMDLTSGVFTAPRGGIYHFEFSGVKDASTKSLVIKIRLNGIVVGTAEACTSPIVIYEATSLHSTLQLNKGDRIDLWITGETSLYDQKDENVYRTHFTGWLIEEDLQL